MIDQEDYETLMAEPPGGHNFGSKAVDLTDAVIETGTRKSRRSLDTLTIDPEENRGGWGVVHPSNGGTRGNPNGAPVHPDEYVDPDLLRDMAEEAFGFTSEQVASVYNVKRIREDQRQLRADMDARLLALSRSGANMLRLAEVLGFSRSTANRALARARAVEVEGA